MSRESRLLDYADELDPFERAAIFAIRKTFDVPTIHHGIQWLQRSVGARWILGATSNIRHIHGLERLPEFERGRSYICVANHRSFFDLYVVTALLVARGLQHRILFPVRSGFWYDNPLGPFVNGAMSFLAMYPPLFRERKRAALNIASLNEVVELVNRGDTFLGIHPEGRRKLDEDPYTFLPAQPGVGRIIHRTRATVLPVYINGLLNDLPKQVIGNFKRSIPDVHVVFGRPIDFGPLFDAADSPRAHRAIAERTLEIIGELGQEERSIRQSKGL